MYNYEKLKRLDNIVYIVSSSIKRQKNFRRNYIRSGAPITVKSAW